MARQIQLRRGTKAQNELFTGAEGELTMDTDTKNLRIHDGSTAGGTLIPTLVGFQRPTSSNNYTWYRLYSDGWVEQGGKVSVSQTSAQIVVDVPLIIPLDSNAAQIPLASYTYKTGQSMVIANISCTEDNFHVVAETNNSQVSANSGIISWSVSGQAA